MVWWHESVAQEDLRKRRAEEERAAREEEFLRSSLRGSKKLQALENKPPRSGRENTAFELEETPTLPLGASVAPCQMELQRIAGVTELLVSLRRLEAHVRGSADLSSVEALIRQPDFQKVLAIHNKVQELWCFTCPPLPLVDFASQLAQDVIGLLQECLSPEASELLDLLSRFELEGLLYAHDHVASRQCVPPMSPDEELLDRAAHYTEDSVKIVRIDKTHEPLKRVKRPMFGATQGATVRNEGESVIIGRIVKGGAAEKSGDHSCMCPGLLHEGDEILEVNGIEMRGKSVNDVCDILLHVKALFDYDPEEDMYLPCRELGIGFHKGDILHVISQADPNWWQAYREGEEEQHTLAGLIPAPSFQYHCNKIKCVCSEFDEEPILIYEEVGLYYPRANHKRPIVLIGPPNVGRHEMRQKLMEDTERFAAAIPRKSPPPDSGDIACEIYYTSRARKDGEIDGVDYHFITRLQFEADILSGKFVEHGEYEKNYYGTSVNAIRTVVNSGKICVLNLHPQVKHTPSLVLCYHMTLSANHHAMIFYSSVVDIQVQMCCVVVQSLKLLRQSDLKPFMVFVAPPSLEKFRQIRSRMGGPVKDEELRDIIEKARDMEDSFGHYFDAVIVNADFDRAFSELVKQINILEREPQWVPAVWLTPPS
ncbi:MPP5 [Cordylochernes scorpioides]|uniref:MPP5 n=1 Tax=Cordylochernes scorpioides TaxID=51811 RepID=A0ABY6L159_9ARAC|nr:MPP5 [Cordylochernes scorpioides]